MNSTHASLLCAMRRRLHRAGLCTSSNQETATIALLLPECYRRKHAWQNVSLAFCTKRQHCIYNARENFSDQRLTPKKIHQTKNKCVGCCDNIWKAMECNIALCVISQMEIGQGHKCVQLCSQMKWQMFRVEQREHKTIKRRQHSKQQNLGATCCK